MASGLLIGGIIVVLFFAFVVWLGWEALLAYLVTNQSSPRILGLFLKLDENGQPVYETRRLKGSNPLFDTKWQQGEAAHDEVAGKMCVRGIGKADPFQWKKNDYKEIKHADRNKVCVIFGLGALYKAYELKYNMMQSMINQKSLQLAKVTSDYRNLYSRFKDEVKKEVTYIRDSWPVIMKPKGTK